MPLSGYQFKVELRPVPNEAPSFLPGKKCDRCRNLLGLSEPFHGHAPQVTGFAFATGWIISMEYFCFSGARLGVDERKLRPSNACYRHFQPMFLGSDSLEVDVFGLALHLAEAAGRGCACLHPRLTDQILVVITLNLLLSWDPCWLEPPIILQHLACLSFIS
jgi:hypothetical protein